MALFQGLFFLVVGVLLIVISYQSLSRGWLPFGSNGFRGRLEIRKDDNPVGFWAVFCLYAIASLAITIYALLILSGACPPLPLRSGKTS
jgi:hypothetical protein